MRTGDLYRAAVGVVLIVGDIISVSIYQPNHITLQIRHIVVHRIVVRGQVAMPHGYGRTVGIVEEVKDIVPISQSHKLGTDVGIGIYHIVHNLTCTQTVRIIDKAQILTALGSSCQFPAVLPCEVPTGAVVVTGRIAYGIIEDTLPVVCRQQVAPRDIAVGVGVSVGGENIANTV